jgi:hypothetical protein
MLALLFLLSVSVLQRSAAHGMTILDWIVSECDCWPSVALLHRQDDVQGSGVAGGFGPEIAHTEVPVPTSVSAIQTTTASDGEQSTNSPASVSQDVESTAITTGTNTATDSVSFAPKAHVEEIVPTSTSSYVPASIPLFRAHVEETVTPEDSVAPSSAKAHVESAAPTSTSPEAAKYSEASSDATNASANPTQPSGTPKVAHAEIPVSLPTGSSNADGLASAIASAVQNTAAAEGSVEAPSNSEIGLQSFASEQSKNSYPQAQPQLASTEGKDSAQIDVANPEQSDSKAEGTSPTAAITPIIIPDKTGSLQVGTQDVPYSAVKVSATAAGAPAKTAVVIGSKTALPGETLTVDSIPLIVSESRGSLVLHPTSEPSADKAPPPDAAEVTSIMTHGSSRITHVFTATKDAHGSLVAITGAPSSKTSPQGQAEGSTTEAASGSGALPTRMRGQVASSVNAGVSTAAGSSGAGGRSRSSLSMPSLVGTILALALLAM